MATPEQPAYRKAVFEARARAREAAAAQARARRQKLGMLAGFGLLFVMLGGLTGGYMALDGELADVAGPSVAISLTAPVAGPVAEKAPERTPTRSGAVQLGLVETTGLQIALPSVEPPFAPPLAPPLVPTLAPLVAPEAPAAESETQRPLFDRVRAVHSDTDRGPPLLPEAGEAVLARLYEEPLETSAGPVAGDRAIPAGVAIQSPPPPMPSLPNPPASSGLDVGGQPAWQRFAVPVMAPGARPMIAVVLDDLGLNRAGTNRAIALPAPLTLAFMTYAEGLPRLAARARRAGHELMLHVPMAPRDSTFDPGPNVLRTELAPAELARRLDWGLSRFEGFVGVNNHMGSRFTASREGMAPVMVALRAHGLLFLDSVTSAASVGAAMARRAGVPYAVRDVFLDNEWRDRAAIERQFARLEAVARRRGSAIGIGHPHPATLDVLARWLPEARARGFAIVPVSAIVRHRADLDTQYVDTSG
jgi:hypothetical protein